MGWSLSGKLEWTAYWSWGLIIVINCSKAVQFSSGLCKLWCLQELEVELNTCVRHNPSCPTSTSLNLQVTWPPLAILPFSPWLSSAKSKWMAHEHHRSEHRCSVWHSSAQVRQACERAQRNIVTESQRAGQTAAWLRQGCDLAHDLLHHAGHAEALALAPLLTHRLQVTNKLMPFSCFLLLLLFSHR